MDHWLCGLCVFSAREEKIVSLSLTVCACLVREHKSQWKNNRRHEVLSPMRDARMKWIVFVWVSVYEQISANKYYHRNKIYWIKCGDIMNQCEWTKLWRTDWEPKKQTRFPVKSIVSSIITTTTTTKKKSNKTNPNFLVWLFSIISFFVVYSFSINFYFVYSIYAKSLFWQQTYA